MFWRPQNHYRIAATRPGSERNLTKNEQALLLHHDMCLLLNQLLDI